jgi:hypothetical protein
MALHLCFFSFYENNSIYLMDTFIVASTLNCMKRENEEREKEKLNASIHNAHTSTSVLIMLSMETSMWTCVLQNKFNFTLYRMLF